MPLTIIKADGTVLTTPPMFTQEDTPMAEIEKTNVVQPAGEPVTIGTKIEITNPIVPEVVYSDAPGAGPEDVPEEDEAVEEPKPKAKAVDAPPQNKAVAQNKADTK